MSNPPTPSPLILAIEAALAIDLPCLRCGRTEKCRCLVDRAERVRQRAEVIAAALPVPSAPDREARRQRFVFAWRKGEKPRLLGPFDDVYAANRQLRRFDAELGYFTWVVQPEPGAES